MNFFYDSEHKISIKIEFFGTSQHNTLKYNKLQ